MREYTCSNCHKEIIFKDVGYLNLEVLEQPDEEEVLPQNTLAGKCICLECINNLGLGLAIDEKGH